MRKILFLGDFVSNDGVANANKIIQLGMKQAKLNKNAFYTIKQNKIARIFEFIKYFFKADIICMCGITKMNKLAMFLCKVFNKPIYYLLHGYPYYEQSVEGTFNEEELEDIKINDYQIFETVNKIICVSLSSMHFMKKLVPEFQQKIEYIFNPIDQKYLENKHPNEVDKRNRNLITSTGGGRRIKNNLAVARAIEEINNENNLKLVYCVVGSKGPDSGKLAEISCVKLIDTITHDEVLDLYKQSYLYVQNSYFETFGLAVIESLILGSNVLISQGVSAKDVLPSLSSLDIIKNNEDVSEIKSKILHALNYENNNRIKKTFQSEKLAPINIAIKLYNILTNN